MTNATKLIMDYVKANNRVLQLRNLEVVATKRWKNIADQISGMYYPESFYRNPFRFKVIHPDDGVNQGDSVPLKDLLASRDSGKFFTFHVLKSQYFSLPSRDSTDIQYYPDNVRIVSIDLEESGFKIVWAVRLVPSCGRSKEFDLFVHLDGISKV